METQSQVAANSPVVHVGWRLGAETLEVGYSLRNITGAPIYVFDRMWSMQNNALNKDWAYIDIGNKQALVARQAWPIPPGLRVENPEAPYGRVVPVDGEVKGIVKLKLPLAETNPYAGIVHRGGQRVESQVEELAFRLAWAPVSAVSNGKTVEVEGEKLVYFPHAVVIRAQHLATSSTYRTQPLAAVALRP